LWKREGSGPAKGRWEQVMDTAPSDAPRAPSDWPTDADMLCRSLRIEAATGYARPLRADSTDEEVDAHQQDVAQRVALAAHVLALNGSSVRGLAC